MVKRSTERSLNTRPSDGKVQQEAERLQAEADADAAASSDVVLAQLQAAALEAGRPSNSKVDIWQYSWRRKDATARVRRFPHSNKQWR